MTRRCPFARRQLAKGVALLGCTLATAPMARAAVVNINVTGFNGVNAGMTINQPARTITSFVPGGDLRIFFDEDYQGLDAEGAGVSFQFARGSGYHNPVGFGLNKDVSTWPGQWSSSLNRTSFRSSYYSDIAPDFGPNRFMGFRFGNVGGFGSPGSWNYGWIEVTWTWTGDPQTSTFQIIRAAYESNVNAGILTGAAAAAVPLPGAAGLAACGLLGLGRRRRH